mmetsp:Transcript_80250/g.221918  ORF Transcript_80250/g.221918 Transcript_80250/m.221918 type:complete len:247 (-) Transcript_80250:1041-1781(-)
MSEWDKLRKKNRPRKLPRAKTKSQSGRNCMQILCSHCGEAVSCTHTRPATQRHTAATWRMMAVPRQQRARAVWLHGSTPQSRSHKGEAIRRSALLAAESASEAQLLSEAASSGSTGPPSGASRLSPASSPSACSTGTRENKLSDRSVGCWPLAELAMVELLPSAAAGVPSQGEPTSPGKSCKAWPLEGSPPSLLARRLGTGRNLQPVSRMTLTRSKVWEPSSSRRLEDAPFTSMTLSPTEITCSPS